jgi:beta-ureidopropionase / N-carbamoyl-L-amino-acid hydrolase
MDCMRTCTRLNLPEKQRRSRNFMLPELKIDPQRLREHFEALAGIGSTGDGGVNRPALSEAHLAARAWFRAQAERAGLETHVDEAGNHSVLLRCGSPGAPVLLLGSHLDSVPHGGRFDGALGVSAALEVLQVVKAAGLPLTVHLEAIDFTDEEGTLVGLLGSSALARKLTALELERPRGGRENLLDGLRRAGLTETGLLSAGRDRRTLAGYLELHIEQGPRLRQAGIPIGVVTGIVGIASYRLTFNGRANHAGTTPMEERWDAAQGAAAFILAVHALLVGEFPGCTANVGLVNLLPGAYNIIPGAAVVGLECRAADLPTFERLEQALLRRARVEAERFGLGLEAELLGKHPPAPMTPLVQQIIAEAAHELQLETVRLPSGAGHDAQSFASLCSTGMIFVPSVDGISHSPREFTEWQDCVNGANVLLRAALKMVYT